MNIACLIRDAARNHPAAPALRGAGLEMDYQEMWAAACHLAKGLRRAGVAPGDRVALVMTNCPEFLLSLTACLAAGFVAVPVNSQLHATELSYILGHSDAGAVIFTADQAAKVDAATAGLPRCRRVSAEFGLRDLARAGERDHGWTGLADGLSGQEPAWLFYTSGTTGRPKGATLTHHNLAAMIAAFESDVAELSVRDRLLHLAPLSHGSGLYALPALVQSAENVVASAGRFDGEHVARALADSQATIVPFLSPVMLTRLVREKKVASPPSLRCVVYGGAPIRYPDISNAVRELGAILVQIYGQGEAPMTITSLSAAEHLNLTPDTLVPAGRPRTGVAVELTDTGEVKVRGDVVMSGYWQDPQATAAAIRDGWLHTGDIGRLDGSGVLTLVDRANDLIISGGLNVYPSEVEVVLQRHPAVSEAVVFAVPDPEWGEIVAAAVVVEPGQRLSQAELTDWCRAHMAGYKKPRAVAFVDALPRNAYGKVLRRTAQAAFQRGGHEERPS